MQKSGEPRGSSKNQLQFEKNRLSFETEERVSNVIFKNELQRSHSGNLSRHTALQRVKNSQDLKKT